MTFQESIPIAKQLAENTLQRGFDVEAFIVLCEISKLGNLEVDEVPDSSIDECIEELLNLFITYYNDKSVQTLKPLLETLRQILSELYHTCDTIEERNETREFIASLYTMATC